MSSVTEPAMSNFQKYVYVAKYARFDHEKGRREVWPETVARYFDFFEKHLKENHSYEIPKDLREELEAAVLNMEVMPSMRALMTAGPALEKDNMAGYNCSYTSVDKPKKFSEIMAILLNGTGVGFSVERQYVNKLPEVPETLYPSDTVINVADSKTGWAVALNELVTMLYNGSVPRWDVSKVRPAGSVLKTFGGRASGPEPLNRLFKFVIATFREAVGRKLTSIEVHDIVCMIGDVVVSGGVRRSAMISLSNLSDDRMRSAKSGQWWENFGHRRLANNSAVYTDKRPAMETFMTEWKALYDSKSGERGIFSRYATKNIVQRGNDFRKANFENYPVRYRNVSEEFGTNPCVTGDTMVTIMRKDGSVHDVRMDSLQNERDISILSRNIKKGTTEFKKVLAWAETRPKAKVMRITDDSTGKSVVCTPDHKIFTRNRGYVEAKDLVETDVLVIDS